MKYCVFDLETTINNRGCAGNKHGRVYGKFAGWPFHPDNKVVLSGVKHGDTKMCPSAPCELMRWVRRDDSQLPQYLAEVMERNGVRLLVGHNLGFDLVYTLQGMAGLFKPDDTLMVWDTMIAEYLISGQTDNMMSLDACAGKHVHGLKKKDDVKEYWDQGVDTADIPADVLADYLIRDLEVTEAVFLSQLEIARKQKGMLRLILVMGDALLGTTACSINGMQWDSHEARKRALSVQQELQRLDDGIHRITERHIKRALQWDAPVPSTLMAVRAALFGSMLRMTRDEYVYDDDKQPVFYKTGKRAGQQKTKKVEREYKVGYSLLAVPLSVGKKYRTTTGMSVSEEALTAYMPYARTAVGRTLCAAMIQHTKLIKELKTYLIGYDEWAVPKNTQMGLARIHPSYNMAATATGRLSCSSPNLQNVSGADYSTVKELFVSRYGDDGMLLQADYSQLEVRFLAHITKDPMLLKDLNDGVDLHTQALSFLTGDDYAILRNLYLQNDPETVEARKKAKRCRFLVQYNGSAKTLAEQTGLSKDDCQTFIDNYYNRYRGVDRWRQRRVELARGCREPSRYFRGTTQLGMFRDRAETGRIYTFMEEPTPWDPNRYSFPPTKLVNYPIQGGATGDLMLLMLGRLYREMVKRQCTEYLVGTIHDSFLFDVPAGKVATLLKWLAPFLAKAPEEYERTFGIKFGLKLPVEFELGKSWAELAPIQP